MIPSAIVPSAARIAFPVHDEKRPTPSEKTSSQLTIIVATVKRPGAALAIAGVSRL
jgi:hypothetical protein